MEILWILGDVGDADTVFMHQSCLLWHISYRFCQFILPTWSHRLLMLYILSSLEYIFVYEGFTWLWLYSSIILYVWLCQKWLCTDLSPNYTNKYMNTRTSKYFTSEVLKGFFLPFTSVSNVLHLSNFRHTLFCTYFLCCIWLMLFGPVQSDVPSDFVFLMFPCVSGS